MYVLWFCPHMIFTEPHWQYFNIGSGTNLEPMLVHFYVAARRN